MHFLVRSIQGLFVPYGTNNPKFGHTLGVGPNWARDCYERLKTYPSSETYVVNYVNAQIFKDDLFSTEKLDRSDEDYELKILFNEADKWIYCYDNSNPDLGIIFSEIPIYKLLHMDVRQMDEDFKDHCSSCITNEFGAYNYYKGWMDLRAF